jgi:thiosulfate/3-mercaptopyruvate sulfurtransferase
MPHNKLVLEPDEVEQLRNENSVVIIDLCSPAQYVSAHIPEACYLPYQHIVRSEKPVMGLLPDVDIFSRLLSNLGVNEDTHVIAYDDEGGGCAARLVWTLHVFGHTRASILNGGIISWISEGHTVSALPPVNRLFSNYAMTFTGNETADADYILLKLADPATSLLDARSPAEFAGEKKLAEKAGHIPGAKNYEWTDAMDRHHNMRLLPDEQLQQRLDSLGLARNQEIICYCQSHHRSAFSWVILKHLGYTNVKGYPGSWSDWGNRGDTPVEV